MNLIVTLEYRFDCTPDGSVWTQASYAHPFWLRYLTVFDDVRVVARVQPVPSPPPESKRVDGEGVSFAALPYYLGPWQYLLRARQISHAARDAISPRDAVILRIPSQIATSVEVALRRNGRPYGVEVVGDPHDVFAPGGVKHFMRSFFRWWFARQQRRQCAGACAAAYVTERTIQSRYPPAPTAFSTFYSSIELHDDAFVATHRPIRQKATGFTLITVASLAQLYKSPDILLKAIDICVREEGLDLKLLLVGDGKYRPELESLAASLGMKNRVHFLGQLPAGDAVRKQLDRADVFILPSRTEGLPRAMVEAMARALPCVGSTAGGIPELLSPEDMVTPGNAVTLAQKIRTVITNPERMAAMSKRNLDKSKEYHESILRERRDKFYRIVKGKTEAWLEREN